MSPLVEVQDGVFVGAELIEKVFLTRNDEGFFVVTCCLGFQTFQHVFEDEDIARRWIALLSVMRSGNAFDRK